MPVLNLLLPARLAGRSAFWCLLLLLPPFAAIAQAAAEQRIEITGSSTSFQGGYDPTYADRLEADMNSRTIRMTFAGSLGHELAARLDLPSAEVRAHALFAHCFTCTKDVIAARRIAATPPLSALRRESERSQRIESGDQFSFGLRMT